MLFQLVASVLSQRTTPFGQTPTVPTAQQQTGVFEIVATGMISTIHAVLAPRTGKILQLERFDLGQVGTHHSAEFDYHTAYSRMMSTLTDIFCCTGFVAPDGRVFSVGGWNAEALHAVRYVTPCGNPGLFGDCDWFEDASQAELQLPRWYPSALPLADGRIAVIGGTDFPVGMVRPAVNQPSVEFLPSGGEPITIPLLVETDTYNLYPIVHLLPNGQVFLLSGERSQLLDPQTFEMQEELVPIVGKRTYPFTGSSVLLSLEPQNEYQPQVLVCGGGTDTYKDAPGLEDCGLLGPLDEEPAWVMDALTGPRVMPDMVLLADGTVLIINGCRQGYAGFDTAHDPDLQALLYDPSLPAGQRILPLAESTIPRLYHSVALLVEDGSVLVMGSSPNANANVDAEYTNERRIEVFYPPYLFSGTRPSFQLSNTEYANGDTMNLRIETQNVEQTTVSLFTNGFVTHSVHQGQRRVVLPCQWSGQVAYTVTCDIPGPNVVPPGWYMVFVTDGKMPSIAQWIVVGGDPAGLATYP
jgi:hypothetical protein